MIGDAITSRRVLIANYRYFISSGPERYLFNIKRMLEGRGHHVMPLSIRYAQNEPSEYERYFVSPLAGADQVFFDEHRKTPATVLKTMSRLFYSREVERAAARMAAETQPDVAYVLYYLRKMSPSLLVGLKQRGLPIVARISDYGMFCGEHHMLRDGRPCTLCIDEGLHNEARYACVKGSRAISTLDVVATSFHRAKGYFDLIDRFVTTNEFMTEMMVRGGIDRARITCISTFTDMDRFRPAGEGPETPPYMLYVGRLDEPKGVHVLIEAMALLRDRYGSRLPELRIAGAGHTGAYVDGLHAQVARLGLADQVRFLGGVAGDAIPALFRGASFSLMPALWYENLPNSVVESLSSGCPVVTSDIGSLAVTITHDEDGLHHRPGDPADLAAQIGRLIDEPALRDRLAAGARATAERNHSPDRHVSLLLNLFEEVIGETDVRPKRTAGASA